MGYSEARRGGGPAVEDFKSAFQKIAVFLGRPSSPTALFSGVPFDETAVTIEDVSHLADKIGLDTRQQRINDMVTGRLVLPALLLLADGYAIALLDRTEHGSFVTLLDSPEKANIADLLRLDIRAVLSFSVVYLNVGDGAVSGTAPQIERRHWLVDTLVPFWRTYLQVALAALFINLLALASPLFTMNVYDRVLPNKAVSTLWVLASGVALAILFDLLLKTARAALIDYAGRQADLRLSYLLFEKVLNTSLSARPMSTGEYASRVTQYEFVREFFTSNTISVLIDTFFVFIFLIVIYVLAGWLVAIPAVAFLVSLFIGLIAQFRIGRRVAAAANEAAQRQSLLVETISTIETVKALRAEAQLLRRWRELSKNAARTSEDIKQLSSSAGNWTQLVQQLVAVGIVVGGAYEFSEGNLSTGAIIASVMLASRAVAPLGQIALTLARLRQANLSLRILNGIMAQPEDRPNTVGFVNREITAGSFGFRGVDFVYPGSDYKVLNGLNFSVSPGERVGIIGRIGSGKTTIGRLLGGLYPATGGMLTIDGIDARQYHPAVIRAAVAVAGQSTDLFSGTVKENLLMGRSGASDSEIVEAARATGVDDFVSRHPRGYDMPVGERGNNLSGGQKQAVTIARLLLANPKIVFLDEPSGAMDLASEKALIGKLSQAFDRTTTVVISTHRYSMLELVDRLIVIDQGRVVADGPKRTVIEELQKKVMATS
ncbi:type I secretion system permease/ATPase [Mesorhizobium sp. ZC-5]|uniref:type I secretion system permease/ATPase n=1 Tax=Mesorhizobium sp. ZC-5 TaxID=2986066 RepID=UPI0021E77F64|nr:type I secretion system permease/ATPase [Mesorhizobium sp. ZC-5]MCV3238892.1 type I secretion system permease/ATPase [Mesorhizobium sp. ZC-5]